MVVQCHLVIRIAYEFGFAIYFRMILVHHSISLLQVSSKNHHETTGVLDQTYIKTNESLLISKVKHHHNVFYDDMMIL